MTPPLDLRRVVRRNLLPAAVLACAVGVGEHSSAQRRLGVERFVTL